MKKISIWLLVIVFALSLAVVNIGCTEEAAPEEAAEEATEEVTEEAEEEEAEEATEEVAEEEAVEEEAVEEEAAQDIEAEITVWAYSSGDDTEEYFAGIGEKLKQDFPGIDVNVEVLSFDGGPDKVNISLATGTTPDILFDYDGRILAYAQKGATVAVDDVIDAASFNIPEGYKENVEFESGYQMAPTHTVDLVWSLNKSLAEEMGVLDMIPEDMESWTYKDFKEILKVVKENGSDDGIYGSTLFAGNEQSDQVTFSMLMASGAKVFNEDFDEVILNSPEGVEMLEFLVSLVEEELVTPGASTLKDGDAITLFNNQKIVISPIGGSNFFPYVRSLFESGEIEEFDFSYIEYPKWDGMDNVKAAAGVGGACIFDNGDEMKIAAAKEFLKVIMGDTDMMVKHIERYAAIPLDPSIEVYKDDPENAELSELAASWTDHNDLDWRGTVPYWSEIRAVFYPEIQAAYSGAKTPQEALDDFVEKANEIVKKNQ